MKKVLILVVIALLTTGNWFYMKNAMRNRATEEGYTQAIQSVPLEYYTKNKDVTESLPENAPTESQQPTSAPQPTPKPTSQAMLVSAKKPPSIVKPTGEVRFATKNPERDKIINEEADFIGLDRRLGKVLIQTESRGDGSQQGKNTGSIDYGLCQINNKGAVIDYFAGKKIKLATGKVVKVDHSNYKTDTRINVHIGFQAYKTYLDMCKGNPYAAYAMYNTGPGAYSRFKSHDISKLNKNDVVQLLRKGGHGQGANNVANNFAPCYEGRI